MVPVSILLTVQLNTKHLSKRIRRLIWLVAYTQGYELFLGSAGGCT